MKRTNRMIAVAVDRHENEVLFRILAALLLSLLTLAFLPTQTHAQDRAAPGTAIYEGNSSKMALENRLRAAAAEFERKQSVKNELVSAEQMRQAADSPNKAASDKERQQLAKLLAEGNKNKKGKKEKDDPEYKEKLINNLMYIKDMFMKAEEKFQAEQYREAAQFYSSVALSNVDKTGKLVEAARKRFVEMEELAKEHLKAADDADLARDFLREVEELAMVTREFPFTGSYDTARRRLIGLKTKPSVSSLVDYAAAEELEASGYLLKAVEEFQKIADNPRYENTLGAMKAARKIKVLNETAATREALNEELALKADKEAPRLLAAAQNFMMNNMPAKAKDKLHTVIEKYPGTTYAKDAETKLKELP